MFKKPVYKIKLKKGDLVMVTKGYLKGQTGRIEKTHPRLNKVTVENLNSAVRHRKPTRAEPQGGIIDINPPIDVSKVAIVEPQSQKPSRIGWKILKSGKRLRIYKKTGQPVSQTLKTITKDRKK